MFARSSVLALTFGLLIASSLSARESNHTQARTAPSKSPVSIETNTLERSKFELEQSKFELERRWKFELEQKKFELEQKKFELEQSKFEFERHNEHVTQLLASLGHFKDWSNYLLVTTVAALGWVAAKEVLLTPASFLFTIIFFCLSIIFAIFTLALIPIVGENITGDTESIFAKPAPFNLVWLWGPKLTLTLKSVCWPQHVSFLVGIIFFSAGSICKQSGEARCRRIWALVKAPFVKIWALVKAPFVSPPPPPQIT